MSANKDAKVQLVSEIKEKIQSAKSVVFVQFQGLTVAEDTELRREFRKNNVEYKVLKNTLVRRAFNDLGVKDFDADLNGPTSVAFGPDEVGASKIIVEASKKYEKKIVVKSGYIDAKYQDANGVKKYASIPSQNELYSMLAGTLSGFTRGLAVAIKAVADKKAEAQA
jgi:large subunit ribosomal protein L10